MRGRATLGIRARLTVGAAVAVLVVADALALRQQPAPGEVARIASGKDLYAAHCATCHGKKGEGTAMGRPLTGDKAYGDDEADILAVIRDGIPDSPMRSFRETLTEAEVVAVTKYVVSLSKR